MARWTQERGTYEFEIIHWPRKKHDNADRLSLGPCCWAMLPSRREKVEWGEPAVVESVVATIMWTQEDCGVVGGGDRHSRC